VKPGVCSPVLEPGASGLALAAPALAAESRTPAIIATTATATKGVDMKRLTIVLAAILVLAAAPAYAQRGHRGGGGWHGRAHVSHGGGYHRHAGRYHRGYGGTYRGYGGGYRGGYGGSYGYRGGYGYNRGWGVPAAVGLGLGGLATGAAAASGYYNRRELLDYRGLSQRD
jgi:hypothetical protein